jgi:MscS family membrane protein
MFGIPVYGLVAGAGVGGIVVALAAKSTLENFMGALNLFADHPVRVRFVGYGHFSLNVALCAYIRTSHFNNFFAVQEDILLRTMKVVKDAGTGFVFPSRTLYLGRDGGLDDEKQQAAERKVREWASAQTLPFPDSTERYRAEIADTLDYPPEGCPDADRG